MNELQPAFLQPNDMWILPWDPTESEDQERVASTLDIRSQLRLVKPGSFDEYSLCFEAALDSERPLPDRERFLLSRYGCEYAAGPNKFTKNFDEVEARMADNVGKFVLVQRTPNLVFIARLSSPNLSYFARIGGHGFPNMGVGIETSSSIFTILDENFKVVPELSRDFVEIGIGHCSIAEGSTRSKWIQYPSKGEMYLDLEDACLHEGDEYVVRFGIDEIRKWQRDNLEWAPHVDNMIEAWDTRFINFPVARIKTFDSSLDILGLREKLDSQ